MLGPEQIERYSRMAVAERLHETIELMVADEMALAALPEAERARRLRIMEMEHEESNRALLRRLAGR